MSGPEHREVEDFGADTKVCNPEVVGADTKVCNPEVVGADTKVCNPEVVGADTKVCNPEVVGADTKVCNPEVVGADTKVCNPGIREVSELALEVGQLILRSGGSTNSCEKLMTRVCVAYGYGKTESFVTPTGIFITVGDDVHPVMTQIRRIEGRSIDLGKISSVTALVHTLMRKPCTENPKDCMKIEEFCRKLHDIENEKLYPEWLRIFCGGATSGFFCLLFGGSWLEFAVAYLVGVLVSLTLRLIVLLRMNNFLVHALGAAMVVVFAKTLDIWIPYIKLDNIIIGGIMLLVPGLSITNAIRDTMSGDLVSGTARAVEAMLISIGIAAGSGTMLKLWSLWGF